MAFSSRKCALVLGLVVASSIGPARFFEQTARADGTWTGGGASNNWSDNGNWGGSAPTYGTLTFTTGGIQGTTSNDDSITAMNKLFWTGSSSWTLNQGGSTVLSLFDNGGTQAKIENQSSGLVTINLPITFAASTGTPRGEINAVSGNITFGTGTLTVSGTDVAGIQMFGGGNTTTFNNTVSASGEYFDTTSASGDIIDIGGSFTSGEIFLMNGSTLNYTGGTITNSAGTGLRLGGDFTTSGQQNLALGATFNLTPAAGGLTFANTINPVTGNTSNALAINSQNTSGTNTLSGQLFLDSNLGISANGAGGLGTLLIGANLSTANTISFQNAGSRTLSVNNAAGGAAGNVVFNEPFINVLNGSDVLFVNGTGTATIASNNSGSGANLLLFNAITGTLAISSANNLGSPVVSGSGYPDKVLFGASTGTNTATLQVNGTFAYGSTTTNQLLGFSINETSAGMGNTASIDVSGSNVFTMNGIIADRGSGTVGNFQKTDTGTLVLSAINTYSGLTTVTGGTLDVTGTLANNDSGHVIVGFGTTTNAFDSTSPVITRNVSANGGNYVGLGSTAGGDRNTTADILSGTNSTATNAAVSMQWRTRTTADINALAVSDVLRLTGINFLNGVSGATDTYVLQMSYDPTQVPAGVSQSGLYLGTLIDGTWENAVLANFGGTPNRENGSWSFNGSPTALGDYGVDTTAHTAWAVVNFDADFAVIPEPASLGLLGMGALALLARRRRA